MRFWVIGLVAVLISLEAAAWPQTNTVGKTSFVLAEGGSGGLRLRAYANKGPAPGWIHCRYATNDINGKRVVTAIVDEILSVGFVTEPRAGEVMKLNVNARAAEFGLKDVFLLGSGEFVVTNVADVARVEREGEGVRISSDKPVVAVMFRPAAEVEHIDGRVRERSDRREGRVFYSPRKVDGHELGNGNVLRYTPVKWLETTNRIEVEVMIRHRPVEFLVDFEKEKAGP